MIERHSGSKDLGLHRASAGANLLLLLAWWVQVGGQGSTAVRGSAVLGVAFFRGGDDDVVVGCVFWPEQIGRREGHQAARQCVEQAVSALRVDFLGR